MKRFITLIVTVAVVGLTASAFAADVFVHPESADYGLVDNQIWQMKTGREPGNLISLLGVTDGKKSPSAEVALAGPAAEEIRTEEGNS